jgi:L-iditol 2-dehydrogenase
VAPGSRVLVTEAGPIGLIAAQTAPAYAANAVTVTDVNPHRLRLAEKLGLGTIDVSQTSLADAGCRRPRMSQVPHRSGNGRCG